MAGTTPCCPRSSKGVRAVHAGVGTGLGQQSWLGSCRRWQVVRGKQPASQPSRPAISTSALPHPPPPSHSPRFPPRPPRPCSAKGHLLCAGICQLCSADVASVKGALERYRDIDINFDNSRECTFLEVGVWCCCRCNAAVFPVLLLCCCCTAGGGGGGGVLLLSWRWGCGAAGVLLL